jgi:hypothetical protein
MKWLMVVAMVALVTAVGYLWVHPADAAAPLLQLPWPTGRTDTLESERHHIQRQWPRLGNALIARTLSRLLRRRNPPAA